jgi:flavin reductase (DIM6/NTAB) family NADH-FMN oxidoreductase RutF
MSKRAPVISQLADDFRKSLRGLASTVSLLTTEDGGERYGMVATAVMSVTLDPPALVVGINRSASIHDAVVRRGWYAVNLLARSHEAVSRHFATHHRSERFAVGQWIDAAVVSAPEVRLPALSDGLAVVSCRVREIIPYGTHNLFLSTVEDVRLAADADPLVYCDGRFGSFSRGS